MRAIRSDSSVLLFWQDLVFLEAALLADAETKALAAVITPVLEEFPEVLKLDLDSRRGIIQASARAYVADAAVDQTIRRLFSAVLGVVEQNRDRQEFTTLFPTHIGDVVRHALRKQVEVAQELVHKLALKIYDDSLRDPHTKTLHAAIKRGKAVLEEVTQAEMGRAAARIDIRTWKDEANGARLTVYGQLLAMSVKNSRGKTWAEGFFPRGSSSSGPEDDEITEPVEPLGPAPAAEKPE